jgi:hypothetical protein
MAEGRLRVTIIQQQRAITGLHVCLEHLSTIGRAFPQASGSMIASSETPWTGECDLCRMLSVVEPERTGISPASCRDA